MDPNGVLMMFLKMILAVGLGALIGIERETHGRPAGLRTHILVSLGAALFTILSAQFGGTDADKSRIASQIVSGIGFLGAGTIIRQGSVVRGLTTAASLWTTAAIGMAAGAGGILIYVGVIAAIITFLTLSLINPIERSLLDGRRTRDLWLKLSTGKFGVAEVLGQLAELGVNVEGVHTEGAHQGVGLEVRLRMYFPHGLDVSTVTQRLAAIEGISSFDWD